MKVLIAGAGLGGLCLAHGLRQAGVEVQVLERRPSPADQPASYGIHLNQDGLAALHACLPAANWAQLDAAAQPARDTVRFWDQRLQVLAEIDHEPAGPVTDPVTRRRAVSRTALRDALLTGLNTQTSSPADIIQWGVPVNGYTEGPGGGVVVHSGDGRHLATDLLVGADGANSRIRGQLLPTLSRQELGILNVAGRVPLTRDVASHLPAALIDGAVNNIVPSGPGWMFISTWPAIGSAPATDEPLLVWAWAAGRARYPADVDKLPPAQLRDLVAGWLTGWVPALSDLVARTDPASVALVPLRTMPPLPAWPAARVTLLGDAIHNMTPMAGIGANTALRDADQLRRALLDPEPAGLTARVGRYEQQMRGYANQALALSTRNARQAATTSRPARLAFRSLLRAAQAVPPVKRAVFGGSRTGSATAASTPEAAGPGPAPAHTGR
jgi:2-polyprenyl-6-methoxyphenol hydroxylase-like FAD-dependent oxidoreductase